MVKLQENINRIKSMMIQEQEHEMQDLFDKYINMTYPEIKDLTKDQHKRDLWLVDKSDDLIFIYYKVDTGETAITEVDGNILSTLEIMFGEAYEELLKNWFMKHYDLNIELILY